MPSLCLVRAKVSVAEVAEAGDYVLALVQYGVDGARDDLGRVRGLGLLRVRVRARARGSMALEMTSAGYSNRGRFGPW